jgi:hypothetical protein
MVKGKETLDENPGEISPKKKKELEEKQKNFEYMEASSREGAVEEQKKIERRNAFFRWGVAILAAFLMCFLAWYLLF